MTRYKVVIRETLERELEINAESEHDAVAKVTRAYLDEIYVLDYSDFKGHEVEVVK